MDKNAGTFVDFATVIVCGCQVAQIRFDWFPPVQRTKNQGTSLKWGHNLFQRLWSRAVCSWKLVRVNCSEAVGTREILAVE